MSLKGDLEGISTATDEERQKETNSGGGFRDPRKVSVPLWLDEGRGETHPPGYVGWAPVAEGFEGQAEGVGRCFPGLCVPVPSTVCA